MKTIKLRNTELEGRNNIYLLRSDANTVLIDTGVSKPDVWETFESEIASHGVGIGDFDTVVLTHWHPDHAGLAGEIQQESGASVYVHEADAPLVAQDDDVLAEVESIQRQDIKTWGLPDHLLASMPTFRETLASMTGIPPTVTPVADGDTIDLGEFEAEVVHTPGHTAGHCGFAFDEGQRAFIGDAVLPTYTPNLGAADVRVENPLATYLHTLLRVAEAGYDRLFPGHHEPVDDPGERVREIVEHHRDRTVEIYEILRERGSSTAWDVATEMFGSLKGTHVVLGASEAAIHLSYLAENGLVTRSDGRYRASNAPSSDVIDGLFLQP